MYIRDELKEKILGFINQGCDLQNQDGRFQELAISIFNFQYEYNELYRKYIDELEINSEIITRWQEIPTVPTSAFKATKLACFPPEKAQLVFETSGTTSSIRGKAYLLDSKLYDTSLLSAFEHYVIPDGKMKMMIAAPHHSEKPHSSLMYMLGKVEEFLGTKESVHVVEKEQFLDERCISMLQNAERLGTTLCILGTSLGLMGMLNRLESRGLRFCLPPGSRIMDTGGEKGLKESFSREKLLERYSTLLGIPTEFCVNEYGMTEMGSQFYDGTLRGVLTGEQKITYHTGPPWVKTRVIDPETMREVETGQTGILCHYDLTNLDTVVAIQTEDMGIKKDDGFYLLGRSLNAETRGCSLTAEQLFF